MNSTAMNTSDSITIIQKYFSKVPIYVVSIIGIFVFGLLMFIFQPVVDFRFYSLPVIIIISLIVIAFLSGKVSFNKKLGVIILLLCTYVLVGLITSLPLFRASSYQNLLGRVDADSKFENDIPETDLSRIRIIDHDVAVRVGQKILGTQTSLGSQTTLGEFFIQSVKGKLYWVAPLLHSGFFKWFDNQDGTPGYVMVSATNELDVRLVQDVKGKPIRIKYQPEAYWLSELRRHIYLSGYVNMPYTDITFEIDDEGNPFWVASIYKRTIGFAGEETTGVAIINPQSGEIKIYPIGNAPLWVDRIQPKEFLEQQVSDWGEYVHGYFNFSHRDQIKPTGEMILIYGQNDHCWWYQGMTSTGQDNSTVGFLLIDSHTKNIKFHKQTGATEFAAIKSAEGKVQEKGYVGSHPVAYNIDGVPTYVLALKDQAGLIKEIAMVSIHDYSIVAVGDDVAQTLRNYLFELNGKGKLDAGKQNTSQNDKFNLTGIIARINSDIQNGNTNWFFTLKEYPQSIFLGVSATSPEIPLTSSGDSVHIGIYHKVEKGINNIIHFDNLYIK